MSYGGCIHVHPGWISELFQPICAKRRAQNLVLKEQIISTLASNPTPDLYQQRAKIWLTEGNYMNAALDLQEFYRTCQDQIATKTHYFGGLVFLFAGNPSQAIIYFNLAIEQVTQNEREPSLVTKRSSETVPLSALYNARGIALYDSTQYGDALRDFEHTAFSRPTSSPTPLSPTLSSRGMGP